MINQNASREREALLRRLRALDQEIADLQPSIRGGEARLPLEEQFRLNQARLVTAGLPPSISPQDPPRDRASSGKYGGRFPVSAPKTDPDRLFAAFCEKILVIGVGFFALYNLAFEISDLLLATSASLNVRIRMISPTT